MKVWQQNDISEIRTTLERCGSVNKLDNSSPNEAPIFNKTEISN